jgi:hypothetical protein
VRNIRRDANESLKKLVKDKPAPEDDERRAPDEVQKLTDKFVADIDKMVARKKKKSDGVVFGPLTLPGSMAFPGSAIWRIMLSFIFWH